MPLLDSDSMNRVYSPPLISTGGAAHRNPVGQLVDGVVATVDHGAQPIPTRYAFKPVVAPPVVAIRTNPAGNSRPTCNIPNPVVRMKAP